MSLKAQLKAARSALAAEDFGLALTSAERVLSFEHDNYLALVFRAAAFAGLNRVDDAAQAFDRAIATKPADGLAWDGKIKMYAKMGKWSEACTTLGRHADNLAAQSQATALATTLETLLALTQQHMGLQEQVKVLQFFLPGSPYYALISTLPPPDQSRPQATATFQTQMYVHDPYSTLQLYRQTLQLLFNLEQDAIDKDVQARRMRLPSAAPTRGLAQTNRDALVNAAGLDIWSRSRIPALLEGVLNHTATTDDGRRWAESELLRYQHRLLLALPPEAETVKGKKPKGPTKAKLLVQVQEMARGMVVLGIADALAWKIHLDWQDATLAEWADPSGQRRTQLRECVQVFAAAGSDAAEAVQLVKPSSKRRKGKTLSSDQVTHREQVAVAASAKALLVKLRDEGLLQYEKAKRAQERAASTGSAADQDDIDLDLANAAAEREEVDPLALAVAASELDGNLLLPQRLGALFSLLDADWRAGEDTALSSLQFVRTLERATGLSLSKVKTALNATVASALVRRAIAQGALAASAQPLTGTQSRNEENPLLVRANKYIEGVLKHQPDRIETLFELGLALECQGEWASAAGIFGRVEEAGDEEGDPAENVLSLLQHPRLEAEAELGWCSTQLDEFELGTAQLQNVLDQLESGKAQLNHVDGIDTYRARNWWRAGECAWRWTRKEEEINAPAEEVAEHKTKAFTCFITSLKRAPSFAPSFTSLGFYYQVEARLAGAANGKQAAAYTERSVKCFQKAFELDAREAAAGYELAREFSKEREWELLEVIARRVVQGETGESSTGAKGKAAPTASATRNAWAWRAIGTVELQANHAEEAIAAFQVALRSEETSSSLWHLLGDAYARGGRFTASLKALERGWQLASHDRERQDAIEVDWPLLYTASEVYTCMGQYEPSLALLRSILDALPAVKPERGVVQVAFAETHLLAARHAEANGYPGRSRRGFVQALTHALEGDTMARTVWKVVGDSAWALGGLPPHMVLADEVALLQRALKAAAALEVDQKLPAVTTGLHVEVQSVLADLASESAPDVNAFAAACTLMSVHVYKMLVVLNVGMGEQVAAAAWYDLAMALFSLVYRAEQGSQQGPAVEGDHPVAQKEALGAVREALRLDGNSARSWALVGNLARKDKPKLAQHALICAIECEPKSPVPWTQLGLVYVGANEAQLANQALVRAQALDPDYAPAWAGQGVVAARFHGDTEAAKMLFEHAVRLSEGSLAVADYGLASAVQELLSNPTPGARVPTTEGELEMASFALDAYLAQPWGAADVGAALLAGLFAERRGAHALAADRIERAAAALEAAYEATEDDVTMARYGLAQTNLARMRLAQGQAEDAEQAFEGALALLPESTDAVAGVTPALVWRARIQAQVGVVLARFWQLHAAGHASDAAAALEETLSELASGRDELAVVADKTTVPAAEVRQVLLEDEALGEEGARARCRARVAAALGGVLDGLECVLVQALYTAGAREAASAALLAIVSERPHCVRAVAQLAAAGIAQGEEDLIAAALAELPAGPERAALVALERAARDASAAEAQGGVAGAASDASPRLPSLPVAPARPRGVAGVHAAPYDACAWASVV